MLRIWRLQCAPAEVRVGLVFLWVLIVSAWLAPREPSDAARIQAVALQVLIVAGTPLLFARLAGFRLKPLFKLRPVSPYQAGFAILLGLCLVPWLEAVHYYQGQLGGETAQLQQRVQSWLQGSHPAWILLTMALVPAVCEELLFRGFVFNQLLGPETRARAVLVSAVLFGIFHRHLLLILPAGLAGILFAVMVQRSRSLAPAILAHFTVNACAVALSNWQAAASVSWLTGKGPVPAAVLAASGIGLIVFGGLLRNRQD
ncbi:MAG: type II CAAX endopeptidase family protein [Acidobacteriota bacterium]|nr:type II CAAX endopeptidase family protein [Acidobacteriota bacterium]